MGTFDPLEIAAIVVVVGGLTALLLEIFIRSPHSFLDIFTDVRRFAERPRRGAEAPAPQDGPQAAPKDKPDDPRLAA